MRKYKRGLAGEAKEELRQEQEQERLHQKYQEEDPDVMIVEKSHLVKFLIRTAGKVIRTLSVIALLVFAAAGLLALVYPDTREGLYKIYEEIIQQLQQFF